jgi:membrane protease YdiL (CAAX protease family)
MKKYFFPFIIFLLAHGLAAVLFLLLQPYVSKDLLGVILRTILSILFFIFILVYINKRETLFRIDQITKTHIYISLSLFGLFAINNYFLANYASHTEFMQNSGLTLVIIGFVINSFYEEFVYRGFIQSYINKKETIQFPLSKGNLFASGLMLITHFGFFMVMDTLFAITGLLLVLIFSLAVGYLRDRGASIWFAIILHTLVNFIHLFINLEHYT